MMLMVERMAMMIIKDYNDIPVMMTSTITTMMTVKMIMNMTPVNIELVIIYLGRMGCSLGVNLMAVRAIMND